MIVLGIILAIIILLLLIPLGVDAAYLGGIFSLKAKIGPFRLKLLPKSGEPKAKKKRKPKKEKKPKKSKKDGAAPAEGKAKKKLPPIKKQDILEVLRTVLRMLDRFRRRLRLDVLELNYVSGGDDPYDAVMNYGCFNAALGTLDPLLRKVFRVGQEDIRSRVDFTAEKTTLDAGAVLSIRLGDILLIVFCALCAILKIALRIYRRIRAAAKAEKTAAKAAAKAAAQEEKQNSEAQKGI